MSSIDYIREWLNEHLFNAVPISIAVINREFNIVYANPTFERTFGEWQGRKCYIVYKDRDSPCTRCKGAAAFRDGIAQVNEEVGYNKKGLFTRYIKHTTPIIDEDGNIPLLIEMSFDITEIEQIRKEYRLLFDLVPCNILIIDRNYRIVRTNKRVRDLLGDISGQYCYEMLKWQDHKCTECTAYQTFTDGQMHTGHHIWQSVDDQEIHSLVTTVPLGVEDDRVDLVMEMAVDITQTLKLEDELKVAYTFMEAMIATSMDGIIALDKDGMVTIFNRAARQIFNAPEDKHITNSELKKMLPSGFIEQASIGPAHLYIPETDIQTLDGKKHPVRLVGIRIGAEERFMGMAITVQDLHAIKQLEYEKLEAERLAAVGQTVAGLAHGVKNLITALEGGMYMLNTGIGKGNIDRVQKGMEMLDRNIDRVSMFVKTFLDFSKGREIRAKLNNPVEIASEVVELYATKAQELGINLIYEHAEDIQPAPIDYESMHECLTNLVGNAIDACRVSEEGGNQVKVCVSEKDGTIIYEVIDNGVGMDYEVKRKVFTSFFTTKGLGGTGLGLLMTKKNVQEHGGTIDLESEPGKGTTFRINLPRNRLPKIIEDTESA